MVHQLLGFSNVDWLLALLDYGSLSTLGGCSKELRNTITKNSTWRAAVGFTSESPILARSVQHMIPGARTATWDENSRWRFSWLDEKGFPREPEEPQIEYEDGQADCERDPAEVELLSWQEMAKRAKL